MNFTPVGKFLLVRRSEKELKKNNIILSEKHVRPPAKGEVLGFGDDVEGIPLGSLVYFADGLGSEIELDGEKLLIMDKKLIFGFVKP